MSFPGASQRQVGEPEAPSDRWIPGSPFRPSRILRQRERERVWLQTHTLHSRLSLAAFPPSSLLPAVDLYITGCPPPPSPFQQKPF